MRERVARLAGRAEHDGQAVSQGALKAEPLGVLIVAGVCCLWLADGGHSFMGYAMQAGSKWLKTLFVWAMFKTIGYVKI